MSSWNVGMNIVKNYLSVCKLAAENDSFFKSFKKDSSYKMILEHCSYSLGKNHLRNIRSKNPKLLENQKFLENDMFGDPEIFDFEFAKASPTTIQYISVLSNLISELKDLTNYKIVEIGGGYGGQAKIICDYFDIQSYQIIDLPEAALLQNRYIEKAKIQNAQAFSYESFNKEGSYDLVISNYALSEVLEPLQTEYIETILLKSRHGYLTCNGNINSMHLLNNKFKTKTTSDIEGERSTNFIVTW